MSTSSETPPAEAIDHVGVVALIGRPNVGKSTLLNTLAGEGLSIVTPKPETTRDRVMAVVTRPRCEGGARVQLLIHDTPGMHEAHRKLGEHMNTEARAAADDADVVVLVADATDGAAGPERDVRVLEAIAKSSTPVVLALNKIDRMRPREKMLPALDAWAKAREFVALVPISAEEGEGIGELLAQIVRRAPEGVALFADDALTDRQERWLVAERIREAVIAETGEEVPYVTAVEIESFDERARVPRIRATVHVERPGQKKIVIGTGGERIRAIGSRARASVEVLLGRQVFLELWVKVTPDWTRSPQALARFGYTTQKKPSRSSE